MLEEVLVYFIEKIMIFVIKIILLSSLYISYHQIVPTDYIALLELSTDLCLTGLCLCTQ